MDLINRLPTGTVGVGSAMPTSTVPSAIKPVKPTLNTPRAGNVSPDAEERRAKKNPKVVPPKPPTRKITVPALDPRVEALDEATYNARSGERSGNRPVVGGEAADAWRDPKVRAASVLGSPSAIGANSQQWRAGWAKGESWRNSITTMSMLQNRWEQNVLTKGFKFGLTGVAGMIGSQGKLNPLAPITDPLMEFTRGNRKGAIKGGITSALMQLAMLGISGAALEGERDRIYAILKENGVPEEYLDGAVQKYIDEARIPTYVNMTAAGTVNDAQIIGMSTLAGAVLAPMTGGVSIVAGIGIGWGLGTIIAGANNVIGMLSMNSLPNLYSAIPYNAYEDPNFFTNAWTESSANKGVADYLAQQDPNRFIPYDEANKWIVQYYSNSTPIAGDPRNEEVYGLIKQGYFVAKSYDGTYGIDQAAYQAYMIESSLYRTDADKKRYLPEISAAGKEFAADPGLLNTQDEWNGIWRTVAYLEYEP
jgi:hypothetical protein